MERREGGPNNCGGTLPEGRTKKTKKAKKNGQRQHAAREKGKAKEVEIEIEEETDTEPVSEKQQLKEAAAVVVVEEVEAKSAEETTCSVVTADYSSNDASLALGSVRVKTKKKKKLIKQQKNKHGKRAADATEDASKEERSETESKSKSNTDDQREHTELTTTPETPKTPETRSKGSRKKTKTKKQHRQMEAAGKAKEAVADSLSLSAESVALIGGQKEEEAVRTNASDGDANGNEEEAMVVDFGLVDLPEEVLLGVLSFLAPLDLVRVSQACRLLHFLSREPSILRALRDRHSLPKDKRAKLKPLFVHPAYYALEQPRYTLEQLASLNTPSVVLDRLVEDGFFFLSLDEADIQVVRDMKAAAARFLAASENLDATSRRSMLYLKTSAAGYAEAPELNSFQTTITHHRFPWPDATEEDREVATRYWRLMGRITVVLLTNLAKHLDIPMSLMEMLLFSRRKVLHRYGDESFLASDTVHVQWSCQLCTLNNPASRRFCAACQGPRPLSRGTAAVPVVEEEGDQQPQSDATTAMAATTIEATGAEASSAPTAPVAPVGSPFTRERVVAVSDEELDRLRAPTLKFYRFRELEKRRRREWRGRDGSLRVFSPHLTPRGTPTVVEVDEDENDNNVGEHQPMQNGGAMVHVLEEPTLLPPPPVNVHGDNLGQSDQRQRELPTQLPPYQRQSTESGQRSRIRKTDFATYLNLMPCNAMFKLVSAHSTDADLCQLELRTDRPDGDNWSHRLPLSKIANEGDIAIFPSWSLSTFCAPFGILFAYRQPSYRVHSRVVSVLSDPFSGPSAPSSSSSPPFLATPSGDSALGGVVETQSIEGRENRAMSDPTAAVTHTSKLGIRSSKGKEKAMDRRDSGKSSSAIVLNKEAKRALIKKHKKAALLLEYDSYVPPPDLVRCMKKVIAMMEKEGNKGVGRWYKKKQGRIIEACPWNRYYPSSSDSEDDESSDFSSSDDPYDSASSSSSSDDEDDGDVGNDPPHSRSRSASDTDSDAGDYYGGFGGAAGVSGSYSDSDMSTSEDLARLRHRMSGANENEATLADVSYWNGPMPLTKHERHERDKRDKRRRRIRKAKKVALTTAFVAAVPVSIVTAPIWIPIGGALALGLHLKYRRR